MLSAKQLKQRARNNLGNSLFSQAWLFGLAACIIVGAVTSVLSGVFTAINLAWAASIVTIIINGPLNFGSNKYFLFSACNQIGKGDLKVLFDGFKTKPVDNVVMGILTSLFIALWSILLIIPGIVKACGYAIAFYIKVDCPQYKPMEVMKLSESIMKGHKMRYFMLQLSFIGWYLVGILTFGIGFLWIMPYVQSTNAEFYRDLILNMK